MTDHLELAQRILRYDFDSDGNWFTPRDALDLAQAYIDLAAERGMLRAHMRKMVDESFQLAQDRIDRNAKLAAARKLHVREVDEVVGRPDYCYHCGTKWPCMTIQAVGDD